MDYILRHYCLLYWSRSLKFCRKAALSGTGLMTLKNTRLTINHRKKEETSVYAQTCLLHIEDCQQRAQGSPSLI